MKLLRLWRHVLVSSVAAFPAGGFLFGLLHPGDPDPNPIGRFFYSCIMAVLTPLHAGFPPHNDPALGPSFNVWPQIAVSLLLILSCLLYRDWKSSQKRNKPTS